jgi:hypothetical protein
VTATPDGVAERTVGTTTQSDFIESLLEKGSWWTL